jgi:hypothetical protein
MPNIIIDLQNEIYRVRSLLPRLAGARLAEAQRLLQFSEMHLRMNSDIGKLKEALGELLDFDLPGTPRI